MDLYEIHMCFNIFNVFFIIFTVTSFYSSDFTFTSIKKNYIT